MSTHEDLTRKETVQQSSERAFGLTFAVVFLLIALFPLIQGGLPRLWALALSALFLMAGLFAAPALRPANRLWLRFGALLHAITSPIILGIMFFLVIMPIGLAMRLFGKDFLRLRFDPSAQTYWIQRAPPGPVKTSLDKQF
jgi:hypothetical protein